MSAVSPAGRAAGASGSAGAGPIRLQTGGRTEARRSMSICPAPPPPGTADLSPRPPDMARRRRRGDRNRAGGGSLRSRPTPGAGVPGRHIATVSRVACRRRRGPEPCRRGRLTGLVTSEIAGPARRMPRCRMTYKGLSDVGGDLHRRHFKSACVFCLSAGEGQVSAAPFADLCGPSLRYELAEVVSHLSLSLARLGVRWARLELGRPIRYCPSRTQPP